MNTALFSHTNSWYFLALPFAAQVNLSFIRCRWQKSNPCQRREKWRSNTVYRCIGTKADKDNVHWISCQMWDVHQFYLPRFTRHSRALSLSQQLHCEQKQRINLWNLSELKTTPDARTCVRCRMQRQRGRTKRSQVYITLQVLNWKNLQQSKMCTCTFESNNCSECE